MFDWLLGKKTCTNCKKTKKKKDFSLYNEEKTLYWPDWITCDICEVERIKKEKIESQKIQSFYKQRLEKFLKFQELNMKLENQISCDLLYKINDENFEDYIVEIARKIDKKNWTYNQNQDLKWENDLFLELVNQKRKFPIIMILLGSYSSNEFKRDKDKWIWEDEVNYDTEKKFEESFRTLISKIIDSCKMMIRRSDERLFQTPPNNPMTYPLFYDWEIRNFCDEFIHKLYGLKDLEIFKIKEIMHKHLYRNGCDFEKNYKQKLREAAKRKVKEKAEVIFYSKNLKI